MSENVGLIAAIVSFLIFGIVAYVVFRLLRKTVKMAFRMAIVAVILAIAAAGSVSFWWLGSGGSTTRPKSVEKKANPPK